ncbi:hypothetical protein HUU62_23115 [Rhodoferax sp. 4810]|nr:hypothetical protein [Rhodoferax jenense]
MIDANSDSPPTIENFLRSATEERVIYCFLDMLAERTARIERDAGLVELPALRLENQRLAAENRQLLRRLAAIEPPELTSLLTYLPALFRNVWGTVPPAVVATLARSAEVPRIPSPFPEPTAAEVAASRQQLLQLPAMERARILFACHKLQHQYALVLRTEMTDVLQEFLG